jgi:Na+-transporting methylmalonyl-CoA/oxaloacetate decarboxylase gamma subunit
MWSVIYETVTGMGYALIWLFIIGVAMYGAMADSKKERKSRR